MAHGLELKLEEMVQRNFVYRKEPYDMMVEEDRIIKSWCVSSVQSKFYKLEFYHRLRKTLLLLLSSQSVREIKRNELLNRVIKYFNIFSRALKNNLDIEKSLIDVIFDPWKNIHFSWDEFFQQKISVSDQKVQEYFAVEPEEIVLARVHAFVIQGREEMAMILAKSSYLYNSRISKNLFATDQFHCKMNANYIFSTKYIKGVASMDWYLFLLQRKKSLSAIVMEIKQLTCHEGVQLVQRLRRSKRNQSFIFTLLQILIMQELIQPSKFCCTKKIFSLWCAMHKEKGSGIPEINQGIRKMLANYAPLSAYFYLFADSVWEQLGHNYTLIVELYVRGLTVDINNFEVAKNREDSEDINSLEVHIASIFTKLSTLFSDVHYGAARECMLSAFSMKPTKERLYILQSLTHTILSTKHEKKIGFPVNVNAIFQECKCDVRCDGSCNVATHNLEHPILKRGIHLIPYALCLDLVSLLESVRCFQFQYNIFDWRNDAIDLGDYLTHYNLIKSWESDTEYASEGSNRSDVDDSPTEKLSYPVEQVIDEPLTLSVKRKNESNVSTELLPIHDDMNDVGANIELGNNNNVTKRLKLSEDIMNGTPDKQALFNQNSVVPSLGLGMEVAIENLIRMSLISKERPDLILNNSNILNAPLIQDDGTQNLTLSSSNKHTLENHANSYSLTSCNKGENINSNFNLSECSSVEVNSENKNEYLPNFTSKSLDIHKRLCVSRESVISPVMNPHKKFNNMQDDPTKPVNRNSYFSTKNSYESGYNNKNNLISNNCTIQKLSIDNKKISMYPSITHNMNSNKNISLINCKVNRNVDTTNVQSSLECIKSSGVEVQNPSNVPVSHFSKSQFLSHSPILSRTSMTCSTNVIHSKNTSLHHSAYTSAPHTASESSLFRPDSKYQYSNCNNSNSIVKQVDQNMSCYQDNQSVISDRSSVIQHTTMHDRENYYQKSFEIPNKLSSDTAAEVRCAPKIDIPNLQTFTINVQDKSVSNSSIAVPTHLVITKKPQTLMEVSAPEQVHSSTAVNNNDMISIPGMLASPSVIVTPWETQQKRHGTVTYRKNANIINPMKVEKRIYKNRPQYIKQLILMPEHKHVKQTPVDKNKNQQFFKTVTSPSQTNFNYETLLPSKQSQCNNNQSWTSMSKLTQQVGSEPSPSQPWYSEPYPKSSHGNSTTYKPSESTDTIVNQHNSSNVKDFEPDKNSTNLKSFTMYKTAVHSNVSTPATYSLNNSQSSLKSSNLSNVNISSSINAHIAPQSSPLLRQMISSSNSNLGRSSNSNLGNIKNIKFSAPHCNILRKSLSKSSGQYSNNSQLNRVLIQEKNPSLPLSHIEASQQHCHMEKFPNSCCSPSEIRPCLSCSLPPADVNLVSTSNQKNSENVPEQILNSAKMVTENSDIAIKPFCYSSELKGDAGDNRIMLPFSNINEAVVMCQFCSQYFVAADLDLHILHSHAEEFDHANYFTAMDSNVLLNNADTSVKALPDVVPEHDSLLHKTLPEDNLPQSKFIASSIVNQQSVPEDDKNIEDVAFNACMDLINSDKELEQIVQGIDTFDQLENNYLPFINTQNANTQNNLNPDLNNQLQKVCVSDTSLQKLTDENEKDANNYTMQYDDVQLKKCRIKSENSHCNIFEFTEKDFEISKPVQKLMHSKPVTTCAEKNMTSDSKNTNEVSISTLAQMIKDTIACSDGYSNIAETLNTDAKISTNGIVDGAVNLQNAELQLWNCQYCSKKLRTSNSLKRHIRKLHSNLCTENGQIVPSSKLTGTTSDVNSFTDLSPVSNVNLNSTCMENNSSLPLTSKKIALEPSMLEIGPILPKGKNKIIKSRTCPCKFCGRVLTLPYMKKHIEKQHADQEYSADSIKTENSSLGIKDVDNANPIELDASKVATILKNHIQEKQAVQQCNGTCIKNEKSPECSCNINISSESQIDVSNVTAVSAVLEPDIDSSTCLSVSDALKRNSSYTITDASIESGKLPEKDNVKFNFNNISKDVDANPSISKDHNLFPNLSEPHLNSGNISESEAKPDVAYTKRGFSVKRFSCNLCNKVYCAKYSLKKHLKRDHDIELPKSSKKFPITSPDVYSVSTVTCQPKSADVSRKSTSHISKKVVSPEVCKLHKSGDKLKNSFSKMNNNLLKSVLKANFESELETKYAEEIKESVCCKNITSVKDSIKDNTHVSLETINKNDLKYSNTQLPVKISSPNSKTYGLNKPVRTYIRQASNISESFQSNKLSKTGNVKESHDLFTDNHFNNNQSCMVTKLENEECEEVSHKANKAKISAINDFECGVSFENSTVQSNEISPISEIISNISKCHFGGVSDKAKDEKELLYDNSLKLLIPENQKSTTNFVKQDEFMLPLLEETELNMKEPNCEQLQLISSVEKCETNILEIESVNISNNFVAPCSSEVDYYLTSAHNHEHKNVENVLEDKFQHHRSNKIRCRFCQHNLNSLDCLTKHLKEAHNIPVLKKQVPEQPAPKLIQQEECEKLSPPKLKLGSIESDSESISEFDTVYNLPKTTDSLKTIASIPKIEESCVSSPFPSEQTLPNKIILETSMQHENTETKMQEKLNSKNFNAECQRKPMTVTTSCKYISRRNSFSDIKSFFLQVKNNKYLNPIFSNNIECKNACGILKVKSVSLPNFQVALNVTTSHIEYEQNKTDTSVKSIDLVPGENSDHLKQNEVEHSTGENTSFSNVTDVTEVSKTSCDISSENCPIAISVKSDFLYPKPVLRVLNPISKLTSPSAKISGKKLLLRKLKSYRQTVMQREIKTKYVSNTKFSKSQNKYKPIIVTLKKDTEISEFLKTHKQPTVKLTRLKEDSYKTSHLNKKIPIKDNFIKNAIVKIEKLHIPSEDLLFDSEKFLVSHIASKKCQMNALHVQSRKKQRIKCSNVNQHPHSSDILHTKISARHGPSPEIIDLTSDSNEATSFSRHHNVETFAVKLEYPVETKVSCTVPHTKECFVMLKRVST